MRARGPELRRSRPNIEYSVFWRNIARRPAPCSLAVQAVFAFAYFPNPAEGFNLAVVTNSGQPLAILLKEAVKPWAQVHEAPQHVTL